MTHEEAIDKAEWVLDRTPSHQDAQLSQMALRLLVDAAKRELISKP